jgi:hypothetical protein
VTKYLPYPPLQRITFVCPHCDVTFVVFSHYREVCSAQASHPCVQVVPTGKLGQTKTRTTWRNMVRT